MIVRSLFIRAFKIDFVFRAFIVSALTLSIFFAGSCKPILLINYQNDVSKNIDECIITKKRIYIPVADEVLLSKNVYSLQQIGPYPPIPTDLKYLVLRNVLLGNEFQLLYNGSFLGSITYKDFDIYCMEPFLEFDEAIHLNHYHSWFYAHTIHDVFPTFLLLPTKLREKLPIIVTKFHQHHKEFFEIMGWNTKNLVNIYKTQYISVKKLHCIVHLENNVIATVLVNLSKALKDKLNLNSVTPTKYIFINRKKGVCRHVVNTEELLQAFKAQFPNITFEMITDRVNGGFKAAALYWAHVKLVFGSTGSHITGNLLFMKEKTAVVSCIYDWPDPNMAIQGKSLNLYMVIWQQPEYRHYRSYEIKFDLIQSMMSLEHALFLLGDINKNISKYFINI